MISVLTSSEANRLDALEGIIESGWRKSGEALMEIRDSRLWKAGYKSWAEYCEKRWGYTKRHCNRLIEGVETVNALPEQVGPIGPTINTESQARELAKAAPQDRAAVVQEVAKNGHVTAKAIKTEVQKRNTQPKPAAVTSVRNVTPEPVEQTFSKAEEERLNSTPKSSAAMLVEEIRSIADALEADSELGMPGDEVEFGLIADRLVAVAKKVRGLEL